MSTGYNGLPAYYVESADPITPNLGLSLKGMDPVTAENFVIIDNNAGTIPNPLTVAGLVVNDSLGTQWGAPTGGAQGAGTINSAGGLFVNGVAVLTSVRWDQIQNAGANLTLANGAFTTTINQTSAVAWTLANTTAATLGTNQNSPKLTLQGSAYGTGSGAGNQSWVLQEVMPVKTFAISNIVETTHLVTLTIPNAVPTLPIGAPNSSSTKIYLTGLTVGTWLNGKTIVVTGVSSQGAAGCTIQFIDPTGHANQPSTAETGTVVQLDPPTASFTQSGISTYGCPSVMLNYPATASDPGMGLSWGTNGSVSAMLSGGLFGNTQNGISVGNTQNAPGGLILSGTQSGEGFAALALGTLWAQGINPAFNSPGITVTSPSGGTSTTWTYAVECFDINGFSAGIGNTVTTTQGPSTLSATNFNTITWGPIPGTYYYIVHRTAAGGTPSTTGILMASLVYANGTLSFNDTGATATAWTQVANFTGSISATSFQAGIGGGSTQNTGAGFFANNGSATSPSYGFFSDLNTSAGGFGNGVTPVQTGLYKASAGVMGFTAAGTASLAFGANVLRSTSTGVLGFSSTSAPTAASDTGISRQAAGVVAIGTGAQGSTAGNLQLNQITSYNAEATAALGVPYVRGSVSQTSSTGAGTILSVTPAAAAGSYRIRFTAAVSTATTLVGWGWTATWTDSNGTAQAPTNLALFQSGTAAPALTFAATGNYYGEIIIDVNNSATAIVVKVTFTSGTLASKVSTTIERIA